MRMSFQGRAAHYATQLRLQHHFVQRHPVAGGFNLNFMKHGKQVTDVLPIVSRRPLTLNIYISVRLCEQYNNII